MPNETAFDLPAAKHAAEVLRNPHFNAALEEIAGLRETLRDQMAWIQRHLDGGVHSRQFISDGGAPGGNSWAVVEIPEWECRQKLASLRADLVGERPPSSRFKVGQRYAFPTGWSLTIDAIERDIVHYGCYRGDGHPIPWHPDGSSHIDGFTRVLESLDAQLIERCDEPQVLSENK